jgi:predicted amidohydrolase
MKLGLIQTSLKWNDYEYNCDKCKELAEAAAVSGANFVILPEMFPIGFSLATGDIAKKGYTKGIETLQAVASKYSITIAGSLPYDPHGNYIKPYNTLKVFGPKGKELGLYSKTHLFSYSKENEVYSSGKETLSLKIDNFKVSFAICYDIRFPYLFSELAESTELFVVVANWPQTRRDHWKTLLHARAIESQSFVAAVNIVGKGGDLHYAGDSCIISPTGQTLSDAKDTDGFLICEIDKEQVSEFRNKFPVLRDKRSDITYMRI